MDLCSTFAANHRIDAMTTPESAHRLPPALSSVTTLADALVAEHANDHADQHARRSAPASPTVLFVDQSGQPGGAELSLLPLAARCSARGEVLLLADGPFRAMLAAQHVRVHVASESRLAAIDRASLRMNWFSAIPAILRQIRAVAAVARRHDVVYLNTQKALVLGALGKLLHRRPVIWHARDIMSREHFGPAQLRIVRWLVRHAVDQVIANSRATADALVALTGLPAEAIPVVHNGIDARAFESHGAGDVATLRRQLGLPETACLVGVFGRLAPWKGQHVAIEAIAAHPEAHLVLVGSALFGEDDYEAQLHALTARLGVADRVHFTGFRNDMPAWMSAMDLILHTSTDPEPFGRVVIEAMAAGKAVVASAAGGVLEILRHGDNGWLVQPRDVKGLASAIATLLADRALRERLAAQALADVRRDFSLESYLQRVIALIAGVARTQRPAAVDATDA